MNRETIKLIRPQPFERVGARFVIAGTIPKSWLKTPFGTISEGVDLNLRDINGKNIMGTGINLKPANWLTRFRKTRSFAAIFQFHPLNIGFIEKSQGRIVLELSGEKEYEQSIFIPIIVREFEPEGGASSEIIEKHKNVGKTILQYVEDLKSYRVESEKIAASRKVKDGDEQYRHVGGVESMEIAVGISKIFEDAEANFSEYSYSEEDRKESELEEKYKAAIEWRGPLGKGLVSQFGGFELRVYSNDHGHHFHVTHKGKHINARFSFPELRLESYKNSQNTIGSKEEAKLREFCQRPDIMKKLEEEFTKRG
jgi:hypothetical protein